MNPRSLCFSRHELEESFKLPLRTKQWKQRTEAPDGAQALTMADWVIQASIQEEKECLFFLLDATAKGAEIFLHKFTQNLN